MLSITNRLFMKFSEPQSNDPHRFYLVTEGPRKVTRDVTWYCEVRHGIYRGQYHYKFPDKSALDQELKTKELDGYIQVSDTNYSSILDNNWLIAMGLRKPLHKRNAPAAFSHERARSVTFVERAPEKEGREGAPRG